MTTWDVDFLLADPTTTRALVILNQPFSRGLFLRLWNSSQWHCCADGGANRLFDTVVGDERTLYLPQLIKGDLDSIRPDVKDFYTIHGVPIVQDPDQYSTDLMKCVAAIQVKETEEATKYDIVLLGGLSGRLDQTIHTLSYLFKLRKTRERVFAVTDDNVGWVLDSRRASNTCRPLRSSVRRVDCFLSGSTPPFLSTSGLRWNLLDQESSFGGLISTSNQFVPGENIVWIRTSRPIWWTAELRPIT
ncbi:thiamine pyrophosphokinase Thi80 [Mycena amicta]|nr:thiamine pyrophosphokinase Thi80 [Mycena amicta]